MENCEDIEDNINYCKYGHVGPLCESCDIQGLVWGGQKFSRDRDYNCAECGNNKV
jgi:hypothetical protein